MSWKVIAKKDFQDAIRSRGFLGLSAVFLLLIVGISVLYGTVEEVSGGNPTVVELIFFVASSLGVFVSIAAIVVCYKSIAGERESGSMKLLLSLPHTRFDVLFGKVLGRTAVIAVPVVIALLAGTVVGSVLLGKFAPVETVLLSAVALLFALTYASVIVGFSAMTGSTTRSAGLALGFFLVFEFLWDIVVLGLAYVGNGLQFPTSPADFPVWVFPISQLPPSNAFVTALVAVVPDATQSSAGVGPSASNVDAFFGTPWIAFAVFAFWVVIPVFIGYLRFQKADI